MTSSLSTNIIEPWIRDITPPSEIWRKQARRHLDMLTKPLGSLGRLEDLAAQMLAIRQKEFAVPVRKTVYIFAADHGITAEGVSAYPREVTHQMVLNFLAQGAAINVLARLHGVQLHVVDVGVDADLSGAEGLLHRKVSRGSQNMLREPALSEEQLVQALIRRSTPRRRGSHSGLQLHRYWRDGHWQYDFCKCHYLCTHGIACH